MYKLLFCLCVCLQLQAYDFTDEPIDVVIPCTEKDLDTLDLCINGIRKYGENIRRVIVISSKKLTKHAEWFDENNYPFSKLDIAHEILENEEATHYAHSRGNRLGWMYQQLLKLYAAYVIADISSNILILDSDTIFLSKVSFLNKMNGGLYNVGTEHHIPYFSHMSRLLPDLQKLYPQHSGITHHMIFQKAVLDDLFNEIETHHRAEPWKAICRCIDPSELYGSAFSEYEIYFNFVFSRTNQVEIRPLKMANSPLIKPRYYQKLGYQYISCHTFMRE